MGLAVTGRGVGCSGSRLSPDREVDPECGPHSDLGFDGDVSTVVAGDMAGDRQAEAGADGLPAPTLVGPVEALEHALQVLFAFMPDSNSDYA